MMNDPTSAKHNDTTKVVPRRSFEAASLALTMALLVLFSGMTPASEWVVDIVQGSERDIDVSRYQLAYDPAGQASILYWEGATQEIRFIQKGGPTWGAPETVASDVNLNYQWLSLAFDAVGQPAASYIARPKRKNFLYFVRKSGSSWGTPEQIDLGNVSPLSQSLAFDSEGNPAIAYIAGPGELQLARWNGASWDTEVVEEYPRAGLVWLAFDPRDGQPAILYAPFTDEGEYYLRYAKYNGATWIVEAVDTDTNGFNWISLAFNPVSGEPAALYTGGDLSQTEVHLAERVAGLWQTTYLWPGWGGAPLVYDSTGTLYVVYTVSSIELWVNRRLASGEWQTPELVDSLASVGQPIADGSLSLNGDERPTVAYAYRLDWNHPAELRYAYPSPAQTCNGPEDCDDVNECTTDDCVAFLCEYVAVPDQTPCTGGICCSGVCGAPGCAEGDCDDQNECTVDTCVSPGTCAATCVNDPFPDDTSCGAEGEVCCAGSCSVPVCQTDEDCPECTLCTYPASCAASCEPDPSCCVYQGSENNRGRCKDGIDNDCDGLIDGEDPECQ